MMKSGGGEVSILTWTRFGAIIYRKKQPLSRGGGAGGKIDGKLIFTMPSVPA